MLVDGCCWLFVVVCCLLLGVLCLRFVCWLLHVDRRCLLPVVRGL